METKLVKFNSNEAKEALRNGEVIAFPTETVFGLAVRYDSKEAYDKLVAVKRRPPDKPFTLMGGKDFKFEDFAILNDRAKKVIAKFVPGPITLLLKPKEGLADYLTLKGNTIGIRVSSSSRLQNFITEVGCPLLVPSANKSSEKPGLTAEEVYDVFNGEIPFIVDEECDGQKPSTIVDLSDENTIRLIRQGDLPFEEIKKVYEEN